MSAAPLKILLLALGGEGGGTLTDWLVQAAIDAGYPVQATSIPGVAQRTGATTYYIENLPVQRSALGGKQPVLALSPGVESPSAAVRTAASRAAIAAWRSSSSSRICAAFQPSGMAKPSTRVTM